MSRVTYILEREQAMESEAHQGMAIRYFSRITRD